MSISVRETHKIMAKKKRGIKPQSAKNKGRKHQQWVRDEILKRSPTLEPDDVRSTSMGSGGEDVLLSPAARKLWPISVECKSLAKFAGYTILDQAIANSPANAQPIAVVKANARKPIVIVDAEYFFDLMKGNQ